MPQPGDPLHDLCVELRRYAEEYGEERGQFSFFRLIKPTDPAEHGTQLTYDYVKQHCLAALRLRLPSAPELTNVVFESPLAAETLTVSERVGCRPEVQDMAPYGKERWSGGTQLRYGPELKQIDMRALGKAPSTGEFGNTSHPGLRTHWVYAPEEIVDWHYAYTVHTCFGLGGRPPCGDSRPGWPGPRAVRH